jgi:hypothetical protein
MREGSAIRLFLALRLTLIVGLSAVFRPSDNLPGREVGVTESSQIVGGACVGCNARQCGGGRCGTANGACASAGGISSTVTGTACNSYCLISDTCTNCSGGRWETEGRTGCADRDAVRRVPATGPIKMPSVTHPLEPFRP